MCRPGAYPHGPSGKTYGQQDSNGSSVSHDLGHHLATSRYNGGMTSYYQVLGVGVDAELEEVRRAYYRKAQLFHPDRYAGAPEPDRRQAEAEMKAVNEAWNTLRDSEARRRYDLDLGLTDAGGVLELGEDDSWFDADEPRRSLLRSRGLRLAVALVLLAGIVVPAIAVLWPPDDHSSGWSATATDELRSAAVEAGMTAPQADCFVDAITTGYSPSDDIDRAVIEHVADDCR